MIDHTGRPHLDDDLSGLQWGKTGDFKATFSHASAFVADELHYSAKSLSARQSNPNGDTRRTFTLTFTAAPKVGKYDAKNLKFRLIEVDGSSFYSVTYPEGEFLITSVEDDALKGSFRCEHQLASFRNIEKISGEFSVAMTK